MRLSLSAAIMIAVILGGGLVWLEDAVPRPAKAMGTAVTTTPPVQVNYMRKGNKSPVGTFAPAPQPIDPWSWQYAYRDVG